jgi:hypothetical protein
MSWLFSQALVAEYSAANSSDGALSAPLNTTPTPQAFLSRDKTTDAWSRFPSGLTCEPLTDDRGEELLKSFLAGFLVQTSVPPARAPESPESSQDCGPKWRALSVRFDRASSSWKTAHCLLSEDLPWSSVTLPKWGMMRAGELWERTTLALRTSGTGAGLWPTPNVPNGGRTLNHVKDWRGRTAYHNGKKVQVGLEAAVKMWPTPTSDCAKSRKKKYAQGGTALTAAVKMWPTPCANEDAAGRPGSKMQKMLGNHPDIRGDLTGGTLNPDWTEWLMGWPIGLTASAPLATDKFQQWLRSHGASSADQQHKEAA